MKKQLLLTRMLLLVALLVGSTSVWADVSTLTFTAACGGSGTANDGAEWTVTSDASESSYDSTKGIHYGTGKAAVSYLTLSTSSISGTITKIVVNASGASGTSAKLNVKVNNSAFGSEESLTSSAANYTFEGSASGSIEVKLTQTSAKVALYVKSIAVTYTLTQHTATFSVNGATTSQNFYEGSAIVFPSVPANMGGKAFVGWVTEAIDGTTDTEPSFVNSPKMGNSNVTYYAVFATATGSGEDTYEKLESNSFDANATYVIGGIQGGTGGDATTIMYFNSYDDTTDEDLSWGTCTSAPSTNAPVTFKLSGTAGELVAKDNSGNYLTCITVKKFAMSSTSTTVYLDTDGSIKSASEGNLLRYNHNGGSGGLRWYGSATGAQAFFYKVIPGVTYSAYCTSITVPVKIGSNGWTSLISDKNLNFKDIEGLNAYAAKRSGTTVTLNDVTEVDANKGIVLRGTKNETYYVPVLASTDADVDTDLTGNATAAYNKDGEKYYYVLANKGGVEGFYEYTGDDAIPAGKAFFETSSKIAEGKFSIVFADDETDGIKAVSTKVENGVRYNLAGQKVGADYKGIVIVNGKKVIIK